MNIINIYKQTDKCFEAIQHLIPQSNAAEFLGRLTPSSFKAS